MPGSTRSSTSSQFDRAPRAFDPRRDPDGEGVVAITWAERELLLARLEPDARVRRGRKAPDPPESHREIVTAFAAIGVSRSVELSAEQRQELIAVLDGWDDLPDGLRDLRADFAEE